MEGNAALELALRTGYPVLVAMLDDLKYMFSLQGAMPSPQVINLYICVPAIKLDNRCLDLGLAGKISSLQVIKAHVICSLCFPTEVEEVEAELRQAIDIHHASNPPTLEIIRYGEDKMVNSDSDPQMFERQKWREGYRVWEQVVHQKQLHRLLWREALEMVQQKSDMNLSGDAEHQTEDIEDMEQALEILTVEYPRLAQMLEELKTALSFQAEDEDEDDEDEDEDEDEVTEEVVSAASV
ncbi:unnamed protein product [Miscanthus lutarioriparius]|uniref:Uncharacterized protein n=1 Tax=Miscanthus lutarioriparius TaxID=422564 RepID=A0A811RB34_9POAL|nr:unnamed protein product [Miscanthus lutarioriparius]